MPVSAAVQTRIDGLVAARAWTLMFMGKDLTREQMLFQPYPGASHILWLAGHNATTMDALVNAMIGGRPVLPPAAGEMFGMGSRPHSDGSKYPSAEELVGMLNSTRDRAVEVLTAMPEARLAEELDPGTGLGRMFGSIGRLLLLLPLHETYHAGQITSLRRAQGLPGTLGA